MTEQRFQQATRASFLQSVPLILIISLSIFTGCAAPVQTYEERAQSLNRQLMCPVCPAETIDQSQADLAVQMRELVLFKLQNGDSESEIKDFFVDRYGASVLAEPPNDGFNVLVWIIPPLALLGGIVLVMIAIRHIGAATKRSLTSIEQEIDPAEMEFYIAEINKELIAFEKSQNKEDSVKHNQAFEKKEPRG